MSTTHNEKTPKTLGSKTQFKDSQTVSITFPKMEKVQYLINLGTSKLKLLGLQ